MVKAPAMRVSYSFLREIDMVVIFESGAVQVMPWNWALYFFDSLFLNKRVYSKVAVLKTITSGNWEGFQDLCELRGRAGLPPIEIYAVLETPHTFFGNSDFCETFPSKSSRLWKLYRLITVTSRVVRGINVVEKKMSTTFHSIDFDSYHASDRRKAPTFQIGAFLTSKSEKKRKHIQMQTESFWQTISEY